MKNITLKMVCIYEVYLNLCALFDSKLHTNIYGSLPYAVKYVNKVQVEQTTHT